MRLTLTAAVVAAGILAIPAGAQAATVSTEKRGDELRINYKAGPNESNDVTISSKPGRGGATAIVFTDRVGIVVPSDGSGFGCSRAAGEPQTMITCDPAFLGRRPSTTRASSFSTGPTTCSTRRRCRR